MTTTYVVALCLILGVMLARGIGRPALLYEYPYFMAVAFGVFIMPQVFSLVRFPGSASPPAVESVLLMTLLCVLACIAGYRAPPSRWIVEHASMALDNRRLLHVATVFIAAGLWFTYMIGQMTAQERGGSMWSGKVTIYAFFASLNFPGFAIALRHAVLFGGNGAWLLTILGAWIPAVAGFVYIRREPAAMFVITIAFTLYFCKRYVPPRWAAAAVIVGAMLAIPATTQFRVAVNQQDFSAMADVDVIDNFQRFLSQPAILELRNAAMIIEATSAAKAYNFGAGYWDQMVFRFVPAQLLGREFKEGLMLRSTNEWLRQDFAEKGYTVVVGSTITGMADAFQAFGYFGALFFAALAVVFRSLWYSSLRHDAVFAQLVYMQTTTSAMRAITHQTVDFLPGLAYNLIFLGLAAAYARKSTTRRSAQLLRTATR